MWSFFIDMPVNLAKLQKLQQSGDKARIGGKVKWSVACTAVRNVTTCSPYCRELPEERGRWFIKAPQMTRSFRAHSRSWESTVSRGLRRWTWSRMMAMSCTFQIPKCKPPLQPTHLPSLETVKKNVSQTQYSTSIDKLKKCSLDRDVAWSLQSAGDSGKC